MADTDTQTQEEKDEYTAWLESLEREAEGEDVGSDVEEKADQDEVNALRIAHETAKKVDRMEEEKTRDELIDGFTARSTDREKELFAIYRHGTKSIDQLKAAMQLAKANAAEEAKLSGDDEEKVEARATQKAKEAYGVGPIPPGQSAQKTPEEVYDELSEAARKGDSHAAFLLWRNLPAGEPASPEE